MVSNQGWDLTRARIIAGAIVMAVLGLWGVGAVVTTNAGGGVAESMLSQKLAIGIWAAVALPALAVALIFRGRPMPFPLVSLALLEGPAILSGIFFISLGNPLFVLAGAAVFVPGILATFPRAGDFPEK